MKSAPITASANAPPLLPSAPYLASIRINSVLYPLPESEATFKSSPKSLSLLITLSVRIISAIFTADSSAFGNPVVIVAAAFV